MVVIVHGVDSDLLFLVGGDRRGNEIRRFCNANRSRNEEIAGKVIARSMTMIAVIVSTNAFLDLELGNNVLDPFRLFSWPAFRIALSNFAAKIPAAIRSTLV